MVGVVGSSEMVRWRAAVYWSLIVALVLALLPGSASADEHVGDGALFDDVPVGHVFFDEVAWLASSGITAGRGDGSFGVADPVTRGAMAAFLYRFDGEPEGPFDAPEFSDVPAGSTFATEVAWLASTGITLGRGDGSFGVNDAVTRGAMAAFLYRFDGEPQGPFDAPEFSDVPAGSTFATEVAWLASTGITLGRGDGSFGVNDPVTRGAMAAFLFRYAGEPTESDEDDAAITGFVGLDLERDLDAGTFTFSLVEDAAGFTSVIEIPDPLSSAGTVLVEDLTEASGELRIDGEPVSDAQFSDAVTFDDVIRYTSADADAGQDEAVIDLIDSRVRTLISKVLAGPDSLSFNLLIEPESTFTMTVADESDVDDVVFELAAADGELQSAASPSRFGVIEERYFEVELPGMAGELTITIERTDEWGLLRSVTLMEVFVPE